MRLRMRKVFATATSGVRCGVESDDGAGEGLPGESLGEHVGAIAESDCDLGAASERRDCWQAARIVNPASQQHALATIQAVGTVVIAILALVQSVSSKAEVAQMAARSTVKLVDAAA